MEIEMKAGMLPHRTMLPARLLFALFLAG